MTAPTYMLYTDNLNAGDAKVYVEMGEVSVIPRAGESVTIDRVDYRIVRIKWDVFSEPISVPPPGKRYPRQHATVLVKAVARKPRRR